MKNDFLSIICFLLAMCCHIKYRWYTKGNLLYISGVTMFIIAIVLFSTNIDNMSVSDYGIRIDNLFVSFGFLLVLMMPLCLSIAVMKKKENLPRFRPYLSMLIYLLWAFSQQFIFQSYFHNKLIRVGLGPWSVLVVAVVYASAHLPSYRLAVLSLPWGVVSSITYYLIPNIIALSIGHACLATLTFYYILNKDPYTHFQQELLFRLRK